MKLLAIATLAALALVAAPLDVLAPVDTAAAVYCEPEDIECRKKQLDCELQFLQDPGTWYACPA